ncbi:MAG: hypothetical protein VKM34_01190 [Cyanobacteriota bacterium]|nr:hypothetical protein [Cyanobacteriota bacterium]
MKWLLDNHQVIFFLHQTAELELEAIHACYRQYGKGKWGDKLPGGLHWRSVRLAWIRKAKA